jgi:hypothetical protein
MKEVRQDREPRGRTPRGIVPPKELSGKGLECASIGVFMEIHFRSDLLLECLRPSTEVKENICGCGYRSPERGG